MCIRSLNQSSKCRCRTVSGRRGKKRGMGNGVKSVQSHPFCNFQIFKFSTNTSCPAGVEKRMEAYKDRYERECRQSGVSPAVTVLRLIEKVRRRPCLLMSHGFRVGAFICSQSLKTLLREFWFQILSAHANCNVVLLTHLSRELSPSAALFRKMHASNTSISTRNPVLGRPRSKTQEHKNGFTTLTLVSTCREDRTGSCVLHGAR